MMNNKKEDKMPYGVVIAGWLDPIDFNKKINFKFNKKEMDRRFKVLYRQNGLKIKQNPEY